MILILRVGIVLALVATAACARSTKADDGRFSVVAAFFPLAEAARQVGGDRVRVTDLTPPGVEPHDLELTTRQVDRIEDADVVLLLGGGFQPAVARAAKRAKGKVVTVDAPHDDPHVWLDPVRMQAIVTQVAAAIPGAFAARFEADLAALDAEYRTGLAACARRTIVTAHEAFGHLARRYGLTQVAIAGVSPEAEPDPKRLAALTDLVRRMGTTTVFTETLVSPKVGRALAREAGVRTDVLDPLESGRPGTFVPTMRANLGRLRAALACP